MKKLIIALDSGIFGGRLRSAYWACRAKKTVAEVARQNEHFMRISYAKNYKSELARLCDVYGSDKGEIESTGHPYTWPSHSYTDFYELLFGQRRQDIKLVLECGLGTNNPDLASSMGEKGKPGASLRAWRDYFQNAKIIGIDIDADVLFTEERIDTYAVDQTSSDSIQAFLAKIDGNAQFDIILDDGLHEFHAGRALFENTISRLSDNGVYLIEDVTLGDLERYSDYFARLTDQYYVRFVNLHRPRRMLGDNSIVMITKK